MPIFYNRMNRICNPSDKNSERKWYPVVKSISLASEKEMATISTTVASEGADTEAECTPAKIKAVRPHCRFSKVS